MIENDHASSIPKFTRGEKCIFFHLVLVFSAILVLLIIFILHLYTVSHSKYSAMNTRRAATKNEGFQNDYYPIGAVVLNITPGVIICNSLLLKSKWSLSPANCVVARSHPDMAHYLSSWRILYKNDLTFTTEIKRSIAHSHFDKDTLANNIGLFEHITDIPLKPHILTNYGVQWDNENIKYFRIISNFKRYAGDYVIENHHGQLFPLEKCMQYTTSITDLRVYEFCIVPQERSLSLEYGALISSNNRIVGIFSWGERQMKHLPYVILNITQFHEWLNTMITFF